ncbi:DUF624 domain-containing protein [Halobacillus litoralis]|uniref:DUF624 domain-containing protein n=1 Tax=Halobacillus litoralis TaxID=45668 RepID=UPI001CD1BDBA|nr:DUF624 domain-containing protein [Halobacillus litoralis]MCA0972098.1 DUF624 domain-containing protein [Halobacillus litoralis]
MFAMDGKLSTVLSKTMNFLILGALWFLASLPVLTIGPSTLAMVKVIQNWEIENDDTVLKAYVAAFKEYCRTGWLSTLWIGFGILLMMDLIIFYQIDHPIQTLLLSLTGIASFIYLITSVFFFPSFVHQSVRGIQLIKFSFVKAFYNAQTSLSTILIWITGATIIYIMPVLVIAVVVIVNLITFKLYLRSVNS